MKKLFFQYFDSLRCFFLSLGPFATVSHSKICRSFTVSKCYFTRIHSGCFVGRNFYSSVPLVVESHVMIAASVSIVGDDHSTDIYPGVEIIHSPRPKARPVTIQQGAWIGCGAILLSGITIGRGAIVGAGSVVTKSIPPFTIAVGNPCKVVRHRVLSPH